MLDERNNRGFNTLPESEVRHISVILNCLLHIYGSITRLFKFNVFFPNTSYTNPRKYLSLVIVSSSI